ncbi:hypothetical protein FOD75_11280 (plasmid) [Limosilactobacillus reuteri]|uniref:Uncharacterized protein n=1 Tax=Limosilactobacillus reuteri TaxID=1598 RepID=A0A517D8T9_LIMRT|nr:hypothetical protein [Limosilactobacillus reuteri]QDR73667.1 hypothetical protein FOD75_11280 [Limosilactobacillus reuteri]
MEMTIKYELNQNYAALIYQQLATIYREHKIENQVAPLVCLKETTQHSKYTLELVVSVMDKKDGSILTASLSLYHTNYLPERTKTLVSQYAQHLLPLSTFMIGLAKTFKALKVKYVSIKDSLPDQTPHFSTLTLEVGE